MLNRIPEKARVYDDQALAVKFIQQMSDLFRCVLDSRDKELVPLHDELEFISSYSFMLKTRFDEKLKIEIDIQANSEDYIVPMTLQLLIENAVKHNEVSEAFPLRISIRRSGDFLDVENNLQPKSVGEDLKKTGLKNITQQFAFFSEKPKIRSVPVEEILLFYSEEKASFIRTSDAHTCCIDYALDQVEPMLDPEKYIRINLKYIVLIDACTNILAWTN